MKITPIPGLLIRVFFKNAASLKRVRDVNRVSRPERATLVRIGVPITLIRGLLMSGSIRNVIGGSHVLVVPSAIKTIQECCGISFQSFIWCWS